MSSPDVVTCNAATAAAATEAVWSLTDDCARLRDLARRHNFMIRSADARTIWERRSKAARSTWLPLPESDAELFEQFVRGLHEWLAEDAAVEPVREELVSPAGLGRPALIDENADGPCEICAKWAARRGQRDDKNQVIVWCEGCGDRITGMDHNGGRGVMGTVPHHYHLTMVNGSVPGRKGIHQELCLECAITLRLKVYPPDERDKHGNLHPNAEWMRSYKG